MYNEGRELICSRPLFYFIRYVDMSLEIFNLLALDSR